MTKKLNIQVDTTDMDVALRFYEKVIGLPLKHKADHFEVDRPDVHLEIREKKKNKH